jgi:hypothetical protein
VIITATERPFFLFVTSTLVPNGRVIGDCPWIELVIQHDAPDLAHLHAVACVIEREHSGFAQKLLHGRRPVERVDTHGLHRTVDRVEERFTAEMLPNVPIGIEQGVPNLEAYTGRSDENDPLQTLDVQCNRLSGCRTASIHTRREIDYPTIVPSLVVTGCSSIN